MGSSASQEDDGCQQHDAGKAKATPDKQTTATDSKRTSSAHHLGDAKGLATKMQGQIAVSGRYHHLPKKVEDDYEFHRKKVLGSGFNGEVHQATRKEAMPGEVDTYAIKEFKLRGIPADKRKDLEQECEIFLSMDHPHVARLVDVYDEKDRIVLVMECMMGGELFDRVIKRKKFSEQDGRIASYQMLLAINYLHSHGIVHRDIKLENWLYESEEGDHLKLIDFGFSKNWDPNVKMHMSCGTLSYVAPEVLKKSYTSQCDMWSLGVVVFILLAGYMPFSGEDKKQIKCIEEGKITYKPEKWGAVSVKAKDFVENLLKVDAKTRLTADQALSHPWIEERIEEGSRDHHRRTSAVNHDMVDGMLNYAKESKFRRHCMLAMAWSLSNEERSKLREAFMDMDTNKCGTITLGEFKKVVEEFYDFSDEQVVQVFQAIDAAHNGEIQYSEFLAAMVHSRVNLYDDFLHTAFNRFDTDMSGFLSKENIKEVLGSEVNNEDLDKIMNEVDVDHNGKISFEEFKDYVRGTKDQSHHQGMMMDHLINNSREDDDTPASSTSGLPKKPRQSMTLKI